MIKVLNNKKELQELIDRARASGIYAIYSDAINPSASFAELMLMGEDAIRRIVAYRIWEYNTRGAAPHCLQISKSRARLAKLRSFIMQLCGFNSRTTLTKIIKKAQEYEQRQQGQGQGQN